MKDFEIEVMEWAEYEPKSYHFSEDSFSPTFKKKGPFLWWTAREKREYTHRHQIRCWKKFRKFQRRII